MTRHRTTSRYGTDRAAAFAPGRLRRAYAAPGGVILLLTLCAAAAVAACATAAPKPTIVFPVLGPATYTQDFGDARGAGRHEGNDIMAPHKAIAVAAEGGTVKFWTTSASAGCMLYLYGDSGTTYLYIHLNNDVGAGNDNKGKCVAGTAYAPGMKNGDHVEAGQQVGYVGDSGDANGIHSHLHFEVHPKDGAAVNPYPYLQKAQHLLFSEPDGKTFTLILDGTVLAAADGDLTLRVDSLKQWPSHQNQTKLDRTVTVTAPDLAAEPGDRVRVWTGPQPATADARVGADGAIGALRLLLK